MSSTTNQPGRKKQIRLAPIVEYSAAQTPAQHVQNTHPSRRNVDAALALRAIRTGCAVVCCDGKAGHVAAVVASPRYGYPPQILVRHGWLRPRTVRVSLEQVTQVSHTALKLALSRHELLRQPPYRHDYLIHEAIEALLHGAQVPDRYGDFVAVRATVEHGVVSLRGNVRDATRRLEVGRAVARVPGVLLVRNGLSWDGDITWQVARTLERDTRLQLGDVRIETCLGLVRLFGRIAEPSQRALTTALVEQIPGVHAVGNNLVADPALRCGARG